jgi:hypothetical protein
LVLTKDETGAGIYVTLDNTIKMNIEVAKMLAIPVVKPFAKPLTNPKQENKLDLFG